MQDIRFFRTSGAKDPFQLRGPDQSGIHCLGDSGRSRSPPRMHNRSDPNTGRAAGTRQKREGWWGMTHTHSERGHGCFMWGWGGSEGIRSARPLVLVCNSSISRDKTAHLFGLSAGPPIICSSCPFPLGSLLCCSLCSATADSKCLLWTTAR